MTENSAAVLYGIGDLRIERRPTPVPEKRHVLVQIRAVGVCGSDVHYYEHGRIGAFVVRDPMVLGHEASGVIVARGDGATRHDIGARVAIEPGVPCGRCDQCRRGRYNLCPDVRFLATPPIDGAMTQFLAVHEDFVHPVPDSVSDAGAAMIEPLSVGVWAGQRVAIQPGDDVLVTGAGPIGLMCAASARLRGAASVTVMDVNSRRLEHAAHFGASRICSSDAELAADSASVLMECTGHPQAVRAGLASLRRGGRAVLVGMGSDEITLPVQDLQARELTVTGTFRYANTYPTAIAAVARGQIDVDALVTHRFALADAEAALTAARRDPTVLKAVVVVS